MYKIYEDRDNAIDLLLMKDGIKLTTTEMQAITKVGIIIDGTEYESDTYSSVFDWATREDEGVLTIKLGSVLDAPIRDTKAEIIIYDAANTNGIVWDTIDIKVVDVG